MGNLRTTFAKWNELVYIEVFENYEWIQYIDAYILKFKDKNEKPKSGPYQKVRPVLKELFEDHYQGALRFVSKKEFDDWEYYITRYTKTWIEIEAYSSEKSKTKGNIKLDLRDAVEDLYFTVYSSNELRGRPGARKNGTPITYELFSQFFKASMQFLSDHESYLIYYEQLIENFKKLASGEEKTIENFDISAERAFKDIVEQLDKRKKAIEQRLIENDQDSKEARLKLRGELEGINYSLKTISIYK